MNETLFSRTGALAMIGWLGLVVLHRFDVVVRVIARLVTPGLVALLYVRLMATNTGRAPAHGGFDSLASVSALFSVDGLLVAGLVLTFRVFVQDLQGRPLA